MKKIIAAFSILFYTVACNNSSTDSVQKADSANESKQDSNGVTNGKAAIAASNETAEFLVRAMDGGVMEVDLGTIVKEKGVSARVKGFAEMMITDHSVANDKIKALASARNVDLPNRVSNKNADMMKTINTAKTESVDKAYIDMMVDDHKEDIKEFENASGKVNDNEVKQFINETLPVLRKHLDSCTAIQKDLKKRYR